LNDINKMMMLGELCGTGKGEDLVVEKRLRRKDGERWNVIGGWWKKADGELEIKTRRTRRTRKTNLNESFVFS